jgi:hypothetical protein
MSVDAISGILRVIASAVCESVVGLRADARGDGAEQ